MRRILSDICNLFFEQHVLKVFRFRLDVFLDGLVSVHDLLKGVHIRLSHG